jgi:hypothetical protein
MGVVNILICFTVIGIFVGIPNLMGWSVQYARNRMKGDNSLPEFGFGYIGEGYRMILAMLGFALAAIVVMGVMGGATALAGSIADILGMVVGLAAALVTLAVMIIGIPMSYRYIVHNDTAAGIRFGWALNFIMQNPGTVVIYVVILFVCSLIGSALGIVPLIGSMFGTALTFAWQGAAVAEMAKATNNA